MNRKHTETMINSFTLSQLIEMSGDNRQGLMRECFTASSDNRMEIFRFPCRIDAFVIGVGLIARAKAATADGFLTSGRSLPAWVTGIAFVDNAHIHKEAYKPLYRFNSALTIPGPNVEAMIAVCRERLAALPSDATPVQQAAEVMDEVYKAFVYTPGSTTIRTTAEQALAQRKGVCQDYAHVMLSVCRHVGLTARYIAGLLGGEGATHAWVEVYQDGRWVGLDPTHNRLVDDSYITIAHGRDYRDCMLDIGIFSGYNVQQSQWVNASVHEQVA